MPSSSSFSSFWTRAAFVPVSLPAIVYVRDCLFGVTRIDGSSMEPTLKHGDYVWVRKCDAGTLLKAAMITRKSLHADEEDHAALARFLKLKGMPLHSSPGYIYSSRPPVVLPGHVLVYQNPLALQRECYIKRIVAVGGQWVRHMERQRGEAIDSDEDEPLATRRYFYDHRLEALPVHVLHVEGDNASNSFDSRSTGPISSNLVVGVAEYVVWPPYRWKRIHRQPVLDGEHNPRAVWY